MKAWIVRFASLYLFNLLLLWAIGLLLSPVRVGWAAFWASIVLTLAVLVVKPLVRRMFTGMASRSAGSRTRLGEKVVQYAIVFVVELLIWLLVVWLSPIDVRGWFWGYVLPPVLLLIGFAIYDAIDDRVEARAGALYDRATGGRTPPAVQDTPSPAAQEGSRELRDGLTDEQRRMLDELGKG